MVQALRSLESAVYRASEAFGRVNKAVGDLYSVVLESVRREAGGDKLIPVEYYNLNGHALMTPVRESDQLLSAWLVRMLVQPPGLGVKVSKKVTPEELANLLTSYTVLALAHRGRYREALAELTRYLAEHRLPGWRTTQILARVVESLAKR